MESNTENSKSNYINSLYSLETRETMSSRYKLCNLAKGDNKKGKINDLDEIQEVKEDTYYTKSKAKVYDGAKYVYDRCEIL